MHFADNMSEDGTCKIPKYYDKTKKCVLIWYTKIAFNHQPILIKRIFRALEKVTKENVP